MAFDFDIPLSNQRALLGAFLAAHAVEDAVDIMFTGVGCKPKAQRQIARHDLVKEAGSKMVWADIGEREAVCGPIERLENITLETIKRRERVGVVFITTSAAAELLGADIEAAVRRLRKRAGCPVVYLPAAGWQGDHFGGYAAAVEALVRLADWKRKPARGRVGVLGYFFDRYEADHLANLAELESLIEGAGGEMGEVFLSGVPFAQLMSAPDAQALLAFPYFQRAVKNDIGGRPVVSVRLPVGISATEQFVRKIAAALKKPAKRIEHFIADERARLTPALRLAREALRGKRALLLADTALAVGLAGLLAELGVRVSLLLLLDESLGGKKAFLENSREFAPDFVPKAILENPSYRRLEEVLRGMKKKERAIDFVIGPDIWLPESIVEGAARIEIGFPSNRRHAFSPQPVFGFGGVLSFCQRLCDSQSGVY